MHKKCIIFAYKKKSKTPWKNHLNLIYASFQNY